MPGVYLGRGPRRGIHKFSRSWWMCAAIIHGATTAAEVAQWMNFIGAPQSAFGREAPRTSAAVHTHLTNAMLAGFLLKHPGRPITWSLNPEWSESKCAVAISNHFADNP